MVGARGNSAAQGQFCDPPSMHTVGLCEPGTVHSTNSASTTPRIATIIASLPHRPLAPHVRPRMIRARAAVLIAS